MFIRFLLLITLVPILAFSATSLSDSQNKYDKFTISYLYDTEQHLSIDEITTQEFHDVSNQFSFGYRKGDIWFKISLTNRSQSNSYVLYFTEPLWETFDFYEKSDKEGWKVYHAGLLTSLENRQINDVNPAFYLDIPQGESKTFYIKGNSASSQVGEFQIYSDHEFFRPTRFNITQLYIIYSIVVLMFALFNIYLYIARREAIYAYYIAYLLVFSIWLSILSGYYLLFGLPGWNNGLHAFGTYWILFLTLFSGAFLQLKEHMPRMYNIFNGFALTFFLLGLAITFSVPYTPLMFNIISSVFFAILLILTVNIWRQKYLKMQYYLIALMIYMPTMGMMTLAFNNLIENNDLTRYSFLFGSFMEVLFFNSLMVSRYNSMFTDKIQMQKELIEEKEKYGKVLEDEINSRTNDLQTTNKHLLQRTKELESTKEKLTQQAATDSLSSLYNRRYFSYVASRSFDGALRYKKDLSIMMLDLDDFKYINDTYGHTIGDEIIIQAAKVIQESIRSSDIAARYGGEEFIILAPQIDSEEALILANRIREGIESITVNTDKNDKVRVTVSIGIAHFQAQNDTSIESIIKRADKALYRAKANNKNQVIETD